MAPHRIVLALACSVFVAAPARAQVDGAAGVVTPVDEDARLHFELGRRAFARADYEAAAAEFEEAMRLSQRPELHYNLFLVYHELDREEDAVRELRLYIPSETDPEVRDHLEQRAQRIERAIAEREPAPAEDTGPPPETIDLGERPVDEVPPEPAPPPPPASEGDGEVLVALGIAGLGAAAVALGVSVGTGVTALDQRHGLDSLCAPSCSEEQVAPTRALALAADVSLGVGAALGVAGAVLLGVGLLSSGQPDAPVSVAPVASPSTVGLVVTGVL